MEKISRSSNRKRKLIYGVGVNDIDFVVNDRGNKRPSYTYWHSMLKRCYDPIEHKNYPRYIGCTVIDDWKYLSKFEDWFKTQNWYGRQLDKDLLFINNKLYSPDTCVFIPSRVNGFLTDRSRFMSAYGTGISILPSGNFRAVCNDPYTNKRVNIGTFETVEDAKKAWYHAKHEFACKLAAEETDERIINALKTRYKTVL